MSVATRKKVGATKKKRGRPKGVHALSKELLVARDSYRRKAGRGVEMRPREITKALRWYFDGPPRKARKSRRHWEKIARLIPNYDPWENSAGYTFNINWAERAVNFFPQFLQHIKGEDAGKPFALEPWQQAIIANLFGWLRKGTTLRRYREAFVFVPRKNGKTLLGAGIVTYALLCDGEAGAECYSCAADREQASLAFTVAQYMIARNNDLEARTRVFRNTIMRVTYDGTEDGGFYRPISAQAHSKHGYNAHVVLDDETHTQPNSELNDVLKTSMGARSQPLLVHITTSDYDRPSLCNELHKYATEVTHGVTDDATFLPVLYGADIDDDWQDEKVWAHANPNLGVSVKIEFLKQECERAKIDPAFENVFKRLYLNIRTEQQTRWLSVEHWDACLEQFEVEELRGARCFAGLDLSASDDLTALVLVFPEFVPWRVTPFFWCPHDKAIQRQRDKATPYLRWAQNGHIILTSGNVIDYNQIRRDINEIAKDYHVEELAIDRMFQGHHAAQLFTDDGFEVVHHGQGFLSMAHPTKASKEAILARAISHNGNPVMRWNFANCAVKLDEAGNEKLNKAVSGDKIDGVVAMVMAIGRADTNVNLGSVYDAGGIDFI